MDVTKTYYTRTVFFLLLHLQWISTINTIIFHTNSGWSEKHSHHHAAHLNQLGNAILNKPTTEELLFYVKTSKHGAIFGVCCCATL